MTHHHINYVELPARDLEAIKTFFGKVFGWSFLDYGEKYIAIEQAGLDGGFYLSEQVSRAEHGAALVVLRSDDLEASLEAIIKEGAEILQPIFSFPGGRRFHFADPCGNEWAVWQVD